MRPTILFVLFLLATACGGSSSTSSSSTSSSTPTEEPTSSGASSPAAVSPILLGHFATTDGRDGFVLDRTGQPWLVQRDDKPEPEVLSESNRSGDWIEYTSETVWLRVYHAGLQTGRILYQGPNQTEGVDAIRDADARPLR